ncbi:STM4015 family protein [Alienimonas sp. DA493]|uniref:STM4015 family protein n=1 Tax=Alienimonas sp. DA493 TaxID=3373605 RepID=UPI003754DE4C
MADTDDGPLPTSGEHVEEFFGLPVKEYEQDGAVPAGDVAVRIGCDWDDQEEFPDRLADLLDDPAAAQITALVIGPWGGAFEGGSSEATVEALVAARDRLPGLRALFLGDIVQEETEMSWITQCDVSPLFGAFPLLEEFRVRGSQDLSLGRPSQDNLRLLTIECGGLPASVAREVAAARLPKLERLELWFGDDGYGNEVSDDVLIELLDAPLIAGLTHLGLRNDQFADEHAAVLAGRPRPGRVTTLDLSLGALGDAGADALVGAAWIGELDRLDIRHHFVSPEAVDRLRAKVRELDARHALEPEDWGDGELHRYVAVGE